MYFPPGFSIALSVELAELIDSAYAQFEAFQNDTPWKLAQKYVLVRELSYVWTPTKAIERGIRNFDITLRRLSRTPRTTEVKIPIGFVARSKVALFLILRGTQTVKEWIRNFSISLTDYPIAGHGKVHGGFLGTYEAIRGDIMTALTAVDSNLALFVAGHSLGAALATIAALDNESRGGRGIRAVYTYGSPRVGDDQFVKAFNRSHGDRSYRVANTSDIVTSMPLPAPIAGIVGGYFSHVDSPVDFTVQSDDLEVNHNMATYLSALKDSRKQKGLLRTLLARST
jgi:triacylglycerol lipase